jgi:hypothetical protein
MGTPDHIMSNIVVLSIIRGLAGLTAIFKLRAWEKAYLCAPPKADAAKLQPWLPCDPAAMIRY